tara:strand:- start:977 stop:1825 length:849 start_codon:yes stop_codon:yes gene_type:complete
MIIGQGSSAFLLVGLFLGFSRFFRKGFLMNGLMIHTEDGHRVGLDEVLAVPMPEATKSYKPVSNGELINWLHHQIDSYLPGVGIRQEKYGLSRKDQQMFGVITLDMGESQKGLAIGVRNSYDKSLSIGVAMGAQVFVCDNLCFSGDDLTFMRKHTLNAEGDVKSKIGAVLQRSEVVYQRIGRECEAMKGIGVDLNRGYELIGIAGGHGVITSHQQNIVYRDWRTPRHEDFAERNLWSLYNCFTEGLKKGPAGGIMDRHAEAHQFFRGLIGHVPEPVQISVNA